MKPTWKDHPQALERLAGEYALGTLQGAARRRFESVMRQRPDVAAAVHAWHERLGRLLAAQAPLPVSEDAWPRLEARLFGSPARQVADEPKPWYRRWLGAIPAGALAMGVFLGVMLAPLLEATRRDSQLPESYVGVLADPAGTPGLIVSSLRRGSTVDLKVLSPVDVPAGKTLFLWTLDQAGVPRPVAPVPQGKFVSLKLSQPAEEIFFSAVELAVSIESVGVQPSAPSGPYVYRGLCGKLWRLPGT